MLISFVRFVLLFKSCYTKVLEADKVSTLNFALPLLPLISSSCYSFCNFLFLYKKHSDNWTIFANILNTGFRKPCEILYLWTNKCAAFKTFDLNLWCKICTILIQLLLLILIILICKQNNHDDNKNDKTLLVSLMTKRWFMTTAMMILIQIKTNFYSLLINIIVTGFLSFTLIKNRLSVSIDLQITSLSAFPYITEIWQNILKIFCKHCKSSVQAVCKIYHPYDLSL